MSSSARLIRPEALLGGAHQLRGAEHRALQARGLLLEVEQRGAVRGREGGEVERRDLEALRSGERRLAPVDAAADLDGVAAPAGRPAPGW